MGTMQKPEFLCLDVARHRLLVKRSGHTCVGITAAGVQLVTEMLSKRFRRPHADHVRDLLVRCTDGG